MKNKQENTWEVKMPFSKQRILVFLNLLETVYGFSSDEATCKIIKLRGEPFSVRIHDRLKQLIDEHCEVLIKQAKKDADTLIFEKQSESMWIVSFSCDGKENYLWDNIFRCIFKGLNKKNRERINSGKKVVRESLKKILYDFGSSNLRTFVQYKEKKYRVSIHTPGPQIIFENTSAQELEGNIIEMLPRFLDVIPTYTT